MEATPDAVALVLEDRCGAWTGRGATAVSLVARAFYGDETVAVVDVLLRDKYLREDDMSKRLSLPGCSCRARTGPL